VRDGLQQDEGKQKGDDQKSNDREYRWGRGKSNCSVPPLRIVSWEHTVD
jgi:hypothetical protein